MLSSPLTVGLHIDGDIRPSSSGGVFCTVDPATGETLGTVQAASDSDVDAAVAAARRAFDDGPWPRLPAAHRSAILYSIAQLLEDSIEELAVLESRDTGMPITMTRHGHLPRAIAHFRYFAEEAERSKGESFPRDDAYLYVVNREPLGVAAVFSPWNAPLAVASINVAAAIAFGNTCVLKPSEHSPLSADALASICSTAGLPKGVLNVIQGPGRPTGEALANHPQVDVISFVGSTATGRSILRAASTRIARVGLELGGKSAAVVLVDADLNAALDGITLAAFSSNGEVCTAASRVLVDSRIFERFVDAFVARAEGIVLGDPLAPSTEMGPMITASHAAQVSATIRDAVEQGATLCCGGDRPPRLHAGYYLSPAVLTNVDTALALYREEVFGPAVCVAPFDAVDEAIAAANDSHYGLAAYLWTSNSELALRLAGRLRAGTVAINSPVIRDVRVPFGGFRQSGLGRVGGSYSRDLFTEVKTTSLVMNPYELPRLGGQGKGYSG